MSDNTNSACPEESAPANEAEEPVPSIEEKVVANIKTVYDPEIPVNLYDLGLIYKVEVTKAEGGAFDVAIDMTLTSPQCPIAEEMPLRVQEAVSRAEGIGKVTVNLVWDPPWDKSRMSDEARMQLDMF